MPRSKRIFKKVKNICKRRSSNLSASSTLETSLQETASTSTGTNQSASKKKLSKHSKVYEQFEGSNFKYEIVDVQSIVQLIDEIAVCKHCGGPLKLSLSNRVGLAFSMNLQCSQEQCNLKVSMPNCPSVKLENRSNKLHDINIRFVCACRSIGVGQETAEMFSAVMNLHMPSKFASYNKVLLPAVEKVCNDSMSEAAKLAVEDNDGDNCIAAAFDGSWQRRGFSSLNGVVTANSITTGQVVDVEVLSKFCMCKERFKNIHENDCMANYRGTSGGMEVEGVRKLFGRSEALHNIKYKYYLGDGDSKGFSTISKEQPYGPDFEVEKLECVGHVQKRMGSRLRRYKKINGKLVLSDGKKIGGRGRLTDTAINTIQLFYGLAIRREAKNGVAAMKQAIWSSYFHLSSTDEAPCHGLCPTGEDTWCKFKKSIEEGTTYKHDEHTHISPVVLQEIKPIFRDLANPELLGKCIHGGTQNLSESLNNVIWCRIPKKVFVRLDTFKLGVYDAIGHYNKGNIIKCLVLQTLGLEPGSYFVNSMKYIDNRRILRAEKSIEIIEKKCRQQKSLQRIRLEELFEEEEGPDNPSYAPGNF